MPHGLEAVMVAICILAVAGMIQGIAQYLRR